MDYFVYCSALRNIVPLISVKKDLPLRQISYGGSIARFAYRNIVLFLKDRNKGDSLLPYTIWHIYHITSGSLVSTLTFYTNHFGPVPEKMPQSLGREYVGHVNTSAAMQREMPRNNIIFQRHRRLEISRAVRHTASIRLLISPDSIRLVGPDREMAATAYPFRPRMGAPMQVSPTSCSSRSMA